MINDGRFGAGLVDCLAGDAPQDIASSSPPLAREGDSQAGDAALALWPATFVHWDHVVLGAGVLLLVGTVLSGVRRKKQIDDESPSNDLDRLFAHWEPDSDDSSEHDSRESLPDQTVRTALNPARRGSYPEAPLTVPNAVAASPMSNAADSFLPVAADDDDVAAQWSQSVDRSFDEVRDNEWHEEFNNESADNRSLVAVAQAARQATAVLDAPRDLPLNRRERVESQAARREPSQRSPAREIPGRNPLAAAVAAICGLLLLALGFSGIPSRFLGTSTRTQVKSVGVQAVTGESQ